MDAISEKLIKKEEFRLVSAQDICKEAVLDYAFKEADHVKKVFVSGADFQLFADPALVKYVLYVLIGNALYYFKNRPNSEIVISTFAATRQIQVRDTGPGIAPENLPRLFESFFTSGKEGGAGLGLAFSKRAMKALKGDIYCESVYGQYTAFRLSFPEYAIQLSA